MSFWSKQSPSETLFCKDCQHYRKAIAPNMLNPYLQPKCYHPEARKNTSLVTGITEYKYCHEMREESGPCGLKAKLFIG